MNIQTIKENVAHHCPLVIKLSSGEQIVVHHTDYAMFPPDSDGIFVVCETTVRLHIIDANQVVDVTFSKAVA